MVGTRNLASLTRRCRVHAVGLAALGALTLAACPDDGPAATADTSGGDALLGGRSFLLAARAEGYDPAAATPAVAGLASLTVPDGAGGTRRPVEAVVIPLDLAGIPWGSFVGNDNVPTTLPAPWLAEVSRLEALAADAGLPVVLALSPLSPSFDTLAPEAREESGALVLNTRWKPYCFDPSKEGNPAKIRDQYAGFAVWATERFHPTMVVLGQRLNLYEATCGGSPYEAIKGYVAEAARRVRALATPPTVVATIDVEDLYGYPKKPGRCQTGTPADCLAIRKTLVDGLDADVVGLESYPARAMADLETLPEGWLRQVADVVSTAPGKTAILGTGLPAVRIESGNGVCVPLFEGTEVDQKRWLDSVVAVARLREMPLVVWRSLTDLQPADVVGSCPCAGDFQLCTHLGGLGASADDRRLELARGLFDHDGAPRQAGELWLSLIEGD